MAIDTVSLQLHAIWQFGIVSLELTVSPELPELVASPELVSPELKVDVVSEAGLRPRFRAHVEADRVRVF